MDTGKKPILTGQFATLAAGLIFGSFLLVAKISGIPAKTGGLST